MSVERPQPTALILYAEQVPPHSQALPSPGALATDHSQGCCSLCHHPSLAAWMPRCLQPCTVQHLLWNSVDICAHHSICSTGGEDICHFTQDGTEALKRKTTSLGARELPKLGGGIRCHRGFGGSPVSSVYLLQRRDRVWRESGSLRGL